LVWRNEVGKEILIFGILKLLLKFVENLKMSSLLKSFIENIEKNPQQLLAMTGVVVAVLGVNYVVRK